MANKNPSEFINFKSSSKDCSDVYLTMCDKIINITKDNVIPTAKWIYTNFKDEKLIEFAREIVSLEKSPIFNYPVVMDLCTIVGMQYDQKFFFLFLDFICPRILREFFIRGFLTLDHVTSSRLFLTKSSHYFADYLPKEYYVKISDLPSTKEIIPIIDKNQMGIYKDLIQFGCKTDSFQYFVKYDKIDDVKSAFDKGTLTINSEISISTFDFTWYLINQNNSENILNYAAFNGSKEIVHFLLEKGANVTQRTLECAIRSEDYDFVIELYIKNKEGIKIQDLFSVACTIHNKQIIQWVLDSGPSLGGSFQEKGYGCIAIEAGNTLLTHFIISKVKVFSPSNWYELLRSAGESNSISFLNFIVFFLRVDLKMPCSDDNSTIECELMHNACSCSNRQMIKFLMKYKVDVNIKGREGVTPLITAATDADVETCKILIDYGAEVNAKDKKKYTALWAAVDKMDEDMVTLLLEHKADPNIIPNELISPLHLAASHNCYNIVKKLIDAGANVNSQDNAGRTPLYCAAGNNFYDICKLLIGSQADVNLRDYKSMTPYEYAMQHNARKVAKLLLEHGSQTRQNYEGQTFKVSYSPKYRGPVGSSGSEWSDSDDEII